MRKAKGRYFSVRFSDELLERIKEARHLLYGERTTIAEAIRRLIEGYLDEIAVENHSRDAVFSSVVRSLRAEEVNDKQLPNGRRLDDNRPDNCANAGYRHKKHLSDEIHLLALAIARLSVGMGGQVSVLRQTSLSHNNDKSQNATGAPDRHKASGNDRLNGSNFR